MKTFTASDARNRFGEFLDAGMVEGVKIVRNNRTLGYFVPERQYEEWAQFAQPRKLAASPLKVKLDAAQLQALNAFSAGNISGSEARADLECDRRTLIELVVAEGLELPHLDRLEAGKMALKAMKVAGLAPVKKLERSGAAVR